MHTSGIHDKGLPVTHVSKRLYGWVSVAVSTLAFALVRGVGVAGGCDVIASRNVGDLHASPIVAHTHAALLALLQQEP